MARTVQKIINEDKTKASLGVDIDIDVNPKPADDVLAQPTPEEIAEDLRKQLANANARAESEAKARREAEERDSTASVTAGNAVNERISAQEISITNKIAAAKTNLDSVKSQLKQAKAAGDSDAEVELQDALTNARYELNTAEWEDKQFKAWKEQQAKQPPVNQTPNSPYTVREQEWIDSHPEFASNKKFARVAKLAAQEALDEGHKQDSSAYFKYIETALKENGFLNTPNEEPLSGAGTTAIAAAPVRTGNGDSAISTVNKNSKYPYLPKNFTIPADWVELAQDLGFDDPREYANMRLEEAANEKERR